MERRRPSVDSGASLLSGGGLILQGGAGALGGSGWLSLSGVTRGGTLYLRDNTAGNVVGSQTVWR